MAGHRRSSRFNNDDFETKIIFTSDDREEIESKETECVSLYATFKSGLNLTPSGAGYGHNHHKFNTTGFKFSEESRAKMSKAARERAERERGTGIRAERSKAKWLDPEYRKGQEGKRAGKKHKQREFSEEKTKTILDLYYITRVSIEASLIDINKLRVSCCRSEITPDIMFAEYTCISFRAAREHIIRIIKDANPT